MKLFQIERGVYPFVVGDKSTIDVDAYSVISVEKVEKQSMEEVVKYVKSKYKKVLGLGMDEVHKCFTRLYLIPTDETISMETVEITEGEMVDEFGFGNLVFQSYNENGVLRN